MLRNTIYLLSLSCLLLSSNPVISSTLQEEGDRHTIQRQVPRSYDRFEQVLVGATTIAGGVAGYVGGSMLGTFLQDRWQPYEYDVLPTTYSSIMRGSIATTSPTEAAAGGLLCYIFPFFMVTNGIEYLARPYTNSVKNSFNSLNSSVDGFARSAAPPSLGLLGASVGAFTGMAAGTALVRAKRWFFGQSSFETVSQGIDNKIYTEGAALLAHRSEYTEKENIKHLSTNLNLSYKDAAKIYNAIINLDSPDHDS